VVFYLKKKGKVSTLILFILVILESVVIFFLSVLNFQKAKAYLDLKLEVKSKEEALQEKESKINELNKQLEEIKLIRQELEKKVESLTATQSLLEEELRKSKETTQNFLQKITQQQRDIFEKFGNLTEENRKTYLSLISKMEKVLSAKLALERELEKVRSSLVSTQESPSEQSPKVNLEKIVVQKPKETETLGSILSVNNEYNFIFTDLGAEKNIKPGMRFLVLRNKKKIGEIVIKEVYKGLSLAEPDLEKTELRLRIGDKLIPAE
jgi:septal ring factor EnvC (AmiA/AmiB activator)